MSKAYLTRIKRLETERHRFTDPASMTDEELLVAAFGYDTPAFHRAREAYLSDDDAALIGLAAGVIAQEAKARLPVST